MLIRRLWTRGAPSWSTINPSRQTCGKAQGLHIGASLRFAPRRHGVQQRVSRAYSNYAPRGPPPHYNMYSQPPKSRASRVKDMAIGSVLTVAAFIAYSFWQFLEEEKMEEEKMEEEKMEEEKMEEEMEEAIEEEGMEEEIEEAIEEEGMEEEWMEEHDKLMHEIDKIFSYYHRLLERAETSDDGSLESAEKIKTLFRDRVLSLMYAMGPKDQEDYSVKELGQLPRLPEGHECNKCQGVQKIRDEGTLIFVLPQPPASEMRKKAEIALRRGVGSRGHLLVANVVIAINAFAEGSGINGFITQRPNDGSAFPFPEFKCRARFMLNDLYNEGVLTGPTIVTVFLRDQIASFVCSHDDVAVRENN